MSTIVTNTPVESFAIGKRSVYVKREDLCCPAPSFSKLRGVKAHIQCRDETVIGVLDTFHSKAGWGTSLICEGLSKKCIVFYPVYRNNPGMQDFQRKAQNLGADIIGIDAGRSCILYHYARNILSEKYPKSYMMPNALKLNWIVSVSSGTIAAGVVKGLVEMGACDSVKVVLHQGYSRSKDALLKYVSSYTQSNIDFKIEAIDEGYGYAISVSCPCPFPCNSYYDLKAWNWLRNNIQEISTNRILFWNIGS